MLFSKRSPYVAPNRQEILAAAAEASNINIQQLSYEEAAKALYESLKIDAKSFRLSFASHGITATSYDVIADTTLEEVRKFLTSLKRMYGGLAVYVRIFAPLKYGKKNFLTPVAPGLILWEINGVTDAVAEEIAAQVSEMVGFPLKAERK